MTSAIRDQRLAIIRKLAKQNGGLLTTSQIEAAGIGRAAIAEFVSLGILSKEGRGVYYDAGEFPDEWQIFQSRSVKLIFSYGSALYLWGISDRIPHIWDVTVPQGFNASRIKKRNERVRFHYVLAEKWSIGVAETTTPYGNAVRLYDRERCVVDLVRRKETVDSQLYLKTLRAYFTDGKSDNIKLLRYAKAFNVERLVRDYMEILTR